MRDLRYCLLASASALLFTTAAAAQTADTAPPANGAGPQGATDESITVTATRRSQTLLTAPATVTALSGAELRDSGITNIRDIIALVPNAVIQDDSESFNTYINIRGILLTNIQAEPNFGLFRNGLYYGGHRTNLGSQVDMERVEVLRGPQGGLYGRNAVGGAVNIIYATPTDEFGGYAKASYGTYRHGEVEGAVNMPVSEGVSARVAAWYFNQADGELYNETLREEIDAFNDTGIRFSLSADLSDSLNALWIAEYQETEGPALRTYGPDGIYNGVIQAPPETYDRVRRDTPSLSETQQLYLAQKITYSTEAGDFALNLSYRDYSLDARQDSDQTAIPPTAHPTVRQSQSVRNESIENFYAEAIWTSSDDGPFSWIAGASYFYEMFDFERRIEGRRDLTAQGFGLVNYVVDFPRPGGGVETNSWSAFATATYEITDEFHATAGIRYSHDEKQLEYAQGVRPTGNAALDAFFAGGLAFIFPTFTLDMTSKFEFTAPYVNLQYMPNENLNFYATYSTGFRPGAFNNSSTDPSTILYDQEEAENFEIGMKSRWFDGALNVNFALFYMRQKDMLLAQDDPTESTYGFTYLTNVGTADTYGVELELSARLAEWLNASVAVGYLDPKFDDAIANVGTPSQKILNGKKLPYTREWTVNARLDALVPVSDSMSLIGSAAIRYEEGGVIGDYTVTIPYETMAKIDLTAGVEINEKVRVVGYVENLLDEHIPLFKYYNGAENSSKGRTAGVSITYNF